LEINDCCSVETARKTAVRQVEAGEPKHGQTISDVSGAIGHSLPMGYRRMRDLLHFRKRWTRWVSNSENKMTQMRLTLEHPYCSEAEGGNTLSRVVIGVQSWVHHFQFNI